jgi:uncharacterized repeat protein (TIGR03943 family)
MMNNSMRILQAIVLAGLSFFLFQRFLSGKLFYYINDRFFLLVIFAAFFLFILAQTALSFLFKDLLEDDEEQQNGHENHAHLHEHVHSQSSSIPWSIILLAVPVLLGTIVPAKSLGANAINTKGIQTEARFETFESQKTLQVSSSPTQRNILDWIRLMGNNNDPTDYIGQSAEVVGFVYHDPRLLDDQFLISRFTVSCCVADAFAIGLIVEWPDTYQLAEDTWVRVEGIMDVGNLNGSSMPLILADRVTEVSQPEQPYLFP